MALDGGRTVCPPSFKCPISQQRMDDPVVTCDGHSFERRFIEEWLTVQGTSPLTNLKLKSRTLIPNVALRNAIQEFFNGYAAQDANKIEPNDIEFEENIAVGRAKTVFEGLWRGNRVAVMKVASGTCDAEAAVLARLSKHASLLQFYGMGSDTEGNDYLVTELAPKKSSMSQMMEKFEEEGQNLTFSVMMTIAHQICEGMEAVAAEGLIHRNLALRNVLCFHLDPADPALTDVKVADFGLTKAGQTFYGGEAGAPVRWMPPEAIQERRWSEQSDVWSFGVVLWELFSSGSVPFANLTEQEVADKITCGERLPCPKDCPSHMYKVMQVCWQKRAEDRPNFRSLRIQLRDAERDYSVERALAASHRSQGATATNGTVQLVRIKEAIKLMNKHKKDAKVQETNARLLANLAGTPNGRVMIAKHNGIEALVAAMKQHSQVRLVQECAVAALSNLSASSPGNQQKIAEKKGIEVLIATMNAHLEKPLVQQYGATALRNLTLHNAANKKTMASLKGIEALVNAMKNHPDSASVQQFAADALQNIALHNAENKVAIENAGGIPVLIAAMQAHPEEARVQQYACFALANLSANNAQNASIIAKEGAIPKIIQAMSIHRGKPGVQRYGASALKYLAGENADNQEKIAKHTGIKALVNAMTTHRTNDAVQQYAASALKNLAANNHQNKSQIAADGGIGVLLAAMRSHRMKPLVQQHSASALQNLAGNHTDNKTKIATENGIPLIIAAMNNHPREPHVQRYSASALKNLSSDNASNKINIARNGGIHALVAAIKNWASEPEVQQYAAGALQNIAANNPLTKEQVIHLGGVQALKESIEATESAGNSNSRVAAVRESLKSALRVLEH